MPTPQISPEIAELIGAEQVARIEAEAGRGAGTCRDCGEPVDAAIEAASLVLFTAPPDLPGQLLVMGLTHATCSPSEVRELPRAEAEQYLQPPPEADSGVTAVAAMWGSPSGVRPVLLISFETEVSTFAESGDLVDALATGLQRDGWQLVTQMDTNPTARPPGLTCRYAVRGTPSAGRSAGRLELMVGEEFVLADVWPLYAADQWLQAAEQAGELAVYVGPLFLHQVGDEVSAEQVDKALQAGQLVGCLTPIEVAGGN